MRPTEIIIHCSATKEGADFSIKDIDRWHRERGFKKVGYHYVIRLDGTIEEGRKENEVGAHCLGHNGRSIGICYIGGLDSEGKPKDTRTPEQNEALYNLISKLVLKYDLRQEDIKLHNQFSSKACPCFSKGQFDLGYDEWLKKQILNTE